MPSADSVEYLTLHVDVPEIHPLALDQRLKEHRCHNSPRFILSLEDMGGRVCLGSPVSYRNMCGVGSEAPND